MNIKLVKKLHTLINKYEKTNRYVQKDIKCGPFKITLEFYVDITFARYTMVEVERTSVIIPKESKKYINELEQATGVEVDDWVCVRVANDDFTQQLEKEFQWFMDLKVKGYVKNYIQQLFYNDKEFQPWEVVKANFSQEDMDQNELHTVRISNDYEAIITKGQPIQVGCQKISIDTIMEIVRVYNKVNQITK